MNYPCSLIQDLLPLYCDMVCSEDSAKAVQEHLEACELCRSVYEGMRQKISTDSAEYENLQLASMRSVKKKMKKRNTAFGIAGIVAGALLMAFIVRVLLAAGVIYGYARLAERSEGYVSNDAAEYGEFDTYPVFSKLDVFPEQISADMQVEEFHFYYKEGVLDPEAQIYLECSYTPERYQHEIERLKQIHEEYQGVVQAVTYDTQSFFCPACVAVHSNNHCYEYALLLGNERIAYIFLQFIKEDEIAFPAEYLPEGYEARTDGYSIYVFRQDNGDGYCVY